MARGITWGITLSISLSALNGLVYCQGIGEYSTLAGTVSSATVKAGSAINQTSKALTRGLGENLAKGTPKAASNDKPSSERKVGVGTGAVRNPMVKASAVNTLQVICGPGQDKSSAAKNGAQASPTNCLSPSMDGLPSENASAAAKPPVQNQYPSFINLPSVQR